MLTTPVGDLKNGRTAHSLVKILSLYDVTLNFVSPPSLTMPDSVKSDLSRAGVRWAEYHNLDQVIAKSDVLYATRVQKERFESQAEYEAVKDMFIINNDLLAKAKESAIVMHPLPRVNEIDPEVDFDSRRAAYFRQMRYGLFVSLSQSGVTVRCDAMLMLVVGPDGVVDHGPRRMSGLDQGSKAVSESGRGLPLPPDAVKNENDRVVCLVVIFSIWSPIRPYSMQYLEFCDQDEAQVSFRDEDKTSEVGDQFIRSTARCVRRKGHV